MIRMDAPRSLQTVDRALDILEQVGASGSGLTLTGLSSRVGLSKATVSRLVSSLANRGYVWRDPVSLRYKLGPSILNLTGEFLQSIEFREVAVPHLRELQRLSEETANLAIMDGTEVVYIDRIESPHAIKASFRVGKRAPSSCTALGKAILAFMDRDQVKIVLSNCELPRHTSHSVATLEELFVELDRIRERGVAVDDQEHQIGVRCLGAPVFDITGRVIAAISVSGPISRIPTGRVEKLADLVKNAGLSISAELGCRDNSVRSLRDTGRG